MNQDWNKSRCFQACILGQGTQGPRNHLSGVAADAARPGQPEPPHHVHLPRLLAPAVSLSPCASTHPTRARRTPHTARAHAAPRTRTYPFTRTHPHLFTHTSLYQHPPLDTHPAHPFTRTCSSIPERPIWSGAEEQLADIPCSRLECIEINETSQMLFCLFEACRLKLSCILT